MARIRLPKTLRRLVSLMLVVLVVEYLVLPQVAGARHSLHLLSDANLWLALLGVGLEVAALGAYAQLTLSLLPHRALRLERVFRINMATLSISHVVPAGVAAGGTLGYRLLTGSGVAGPDAAFALALQGIGSAVVLNSLLWVGLIVSIPLYGFNALYGTAAVLGVLLIGFVTSIAVLMTRGEDRAVGVLRAVAARLPGMTADRAEALFRRLAVRLQELTSDRSRLWRCVGWAAANWLLDAASLWVFLLAFGKAANPDGLIVAYGLANVLAALPITPGGLGVVEGVLIPSLVGFNTSKGVATLGVLSWRLVNFWLPIPVGAGTYLSLRVDGGLMDTGQMQALTRRPGPDDPPGGREWAGPGEGRTRPARSAAHPEQPRSPGGAP
ncbi:MAG TPA: YbhN family protein [Acidimicrobiales bacterium]|nr:YbhN family protein [Acidimicrobiales bacterium]